MARIRNKNPKKHLFKETFSWFQSKGICNKIARNEHVVKNETKVTCKFCLKILVQNYAAAKKAANI